MNQVFCKVAIAVALLIHSLNLWAVEFDVDGHKVSVDKTGRSQAYSIDGVEYNHSQSIRLKKSELFDARLNSVDTELFIVQFESKILPTYCKQLSDLGAEVIKYVPDHSLLVKVNSQLASELNSFVFVREVYEFDGAYKVTGVSRNLWLQPEAFSQGRFDVVAVSDKYKQAVLSEVQEMGLNVVHSGESSFAVTVEANLRQIQQLATSPYVLWIEQAPGRIEMDMDIVHIQGGVTSLTQNTGTYKGFGIRGHVLEGIYKDHEDFKEDPYRKQPYAVGDSSVSSHGQKTFGIIYGSGAGDSRAQGLIPQAQGLYTHHSEVYSNDNRYSLTKNLIDNHKVMMQTASWGYGATTEYTARSLEMDKIIFELDLITTQSQSNRSSRKSRPQAWAKNIISVGAVYHGNNTDFSDDSWSLGGASVGPASDNRIKPDIVSYYDKIHTTGDYDYANFGGTSAATPIINGHMGIIIEMFTDGIFGNPLQYPKEQRFLNRPHAATAKALLINSARQYPFMGLNHDMTRVHQGWGHPNLQRLYNLRNKMLLVNEDELLHSLEEKEFEVEVLNGEPQFAATLVYNDPDGMLGAEIHRVNDLDLIVEAPSGDVYYGNYGLYEGNFSQLNGSPDAINTVENVIVKNPMPGLWKVRVRASEINQDSHLETSELDADFALVVSGINP